MLAYDIYDYGGMIRDRVRTDNYARALRASVNEDSVVLDIGTGVGIWSLLACQFGARKVYAIEPSDVIHVARELAVANGFADRIEFIQDLSTRISLPERADILVTDMHGVVPMFEQNLPSMIDARKRLLVPNARSIPEKETLWAAPVESVDSFEKAAQPWIDRPYGLEFGPAQRLALNDWFKVKARVTSANLLGQPACWATLNFQTIEDPNVGGEVTIKATRSGTGHGFLVWFDTELGNGIEFSNQPDCPETIFGQAFFPWPQPVPIFEGDLISLGVRCDLVGAFHLWRWKTIIHTQSGQDRIQFNQSNFLTMPLSVSALQKQPPDQKLRLNREGEIQEYILSLMNGQNTIESVVSETLAKFSEGFADPAEARRVVASLAKKYSE
jgi:protein arginine N-methyltransferase 1